MPRRRGLFRRITDGIKNLFGGAPEPSRPPEPPRKPPPPIIPSEPPTRDHEQHMRDIFTDVTGGLYGNDYSEWRDLYDPLSVIFVNPEHTTNQNDLEIERYWDLFLRAYYLVTREGGHISRQQFHRQSGIPDSEIDWELWREIKRGTT